MDRIIYDIPKWSVYLHRDARGLPPVERTDPAERRFEDELFERLYAGAPDALPAERRHPALSDWAERVHQACDALPDFARLQAECRGDAQASAIATEELTAKLRPQAPGEGAPEGQTWQSIQQQGGGALRCAMRDACARASAAVDEARESTSGMEHVAIGGHLPGTAHVQGRELRPQTPSRRVAERVKNDSRLRRIALLAGRFKRIAAQKRRQRVRHGADEVADVEQGADLARLLPAELARLRRARLRLALLRDLLERRAMQYRIEGMEQLGKGPLVVCLDKSGSMGGNPDIWATAVALALLEVAQRERRPFALIGFDAGIVHESVVLPGQELPEAGLFVQCSGGTDIACAFDRALSIVEHHPGAMRRADVVIVTDGASDARRAPELRERAAGLGVTALGLGIGVPPEAMAPWCDEAHVIRDLNQIDDKAADALFGGEG